MELLMFQVIIVFLATCKGAITEVILVYDLNAIKYLHGDAKFSRGILHRGFEFSREFCMGIPNSLGNFAWGCQIPCLVGDTKNTEVVPKSLGDLTRGGGGVPDPL